MATSQINPGNKGLVYIDFRVSSPHYRGAHTSQHNRYSMEKIAKILNLLDKYAPDRAMMHIRTKDISVRPANIPEEADYARFCDEAKSLAGIGTQDAMRKNLFVDLNRMGLLDRFDTKKKLKPAGPKASIVYVALSEQGRKFAQTKDLLDQYFIFSKAVDVLLGGVIGVLLNIIRDPENGIEYVTLDEYQYFVSAIGDNSNISITQEEAVELIRSWRNLTSIQRRAVSDVHKNELKPENFSGSKTEKRDYHNWRNEAQQVFGLLNQTVYFEVRVDRLYLKEGKYSFDPEAKRLERSLAEKHKYFSMHGIKDKVKGFELHHVVPLAWSENQHHFKVLDMAENMVYIDAFNHARITQNNNRNAILGFKKYDATLTDFLGNEIYFENIKNIAYNPEHQEIMKDYNDQLLNRIDPSY